MVRLMNIQKGRRVKARQAFKLTVQWDHVSSAVEKRCIQSPWKHMPGMVGIDYTAVTEAISSAGQTRKDSQSVRGWTSEVFLGKI